MCFAPGVLVTASNPKIAAHSVAYVPSVPLGSLPFTRFRKASWAKLSARSPMNRLNSASKGTDGDELDPDDVSAARPHQQGPSVIPPQPLNVVITAHPHG